MTFRRRWLTAVGVLPIAQLGEMAEGQRVIVAGKVISAQRPPTAKGMAFLVLEDETGRVQVACPPAVAEALRLVLVESRFVAVSGRVERTRWHRSLLGRLVRPLPSQEVTTTTASSSARGDQRAVASVSA
jgi:error-prone DNA polymerase